SIQHLRKIFTSRYMVHCISNTCRQHHAPPLPFGLNHFPQLVQVVLVAQDVLDGGEASHDALFLLGEVYMDNAVGKSLCHPFHVSPPSAGRAIQKPYPHIFRPDVLLSIHNRLVSQICTNGKGTHYLPPTTVLQMRESPAQWHPYPA